jgi:hypothetical protein
MALVDRVVSVTTGSSLPKAADVLAYGPGSQIPCTAELTLEGTTARMNPAKNQESHPVIRHFTAKEVPEVPSVADVSGRLLK